MLERSRWQRNHSGKSVNEIIGARVCSGRKRLLNETYVFGLNHSQNDISSDNQVAMFGENAALHKSALPF